MPSHIDEISFQLGRMNANLEAIKENTSALNIEVKNISDRVVTIENGIIFHKGAESQNRKIAGMIGSFFGGIFGAAAGYLSK